MKSKKLLFIVGFIAAIIALFYSINFPDLKNAANIYFNVIILALVAFLYWRHG